MFSTNLPIRRSIFPQTGVFSFGADLILDNYTGILDFGVSGNNGNILNFRFNNGRILDNQSNYFGTYKVDNLTNISGTVTPSGYDYFLNGSPRAFNRAKTTGQFDWLYLKPSGVNIQYDLNLYGEKPSLSFSSILFYTGDSIASGKIINNKNLTTKVFSGNFLNISDNRFFLSDFPTGDLTNTGNYYIIPSGSISIGNYEIDLRVITNGGVITAPVQFTVTGNSNTPDYILLDGNAAISNNSSQTYYTNVYSTSGVSIYPTLEYLSGSGNYYTNVAISGGYTNNITGYITNTGYLTNYITISGTGFGGQLNNFIVSNITGSITGQIQCATGQFVWVYPLIVSGYGSGINYTGFGTGLLNKPITGNIYDGSGTFLVNNIISGVLNPLRSISATGYFAATGKINYNSPSNFDMLYVGSETRAIVYNFDYTTINGLVGYLNNNTGTHLVRAGISGGFVALTGLRGAFGNSTILKVDTNNIGNMSVSSSTLYGGVDLGIGQSIVTTGLKFASGWLNTTFTGSGYYTGLAGGQLTGAGWVLDYTKRFTGIWDLSTGSDLQSLTSFRGSNQIDKNNTRYIGSGSPTTIQYGNIYLAVNYTNNYDGIVDVARLGVTGANIGSGISLLISGVAI